MKTTQKGIRHDVYQIVTNQIIQKLEQGTIPWKQPWNVIPAQNYLSKTIYRGLNALLLNSQGLPLPYFLTFKQVQRLGGRIRKGAKAYPVTYWNTAFYDKTTNESLTEDEARVRPSNQIVKRMFLRYYKVFPTCDTTGIDFQFLKPSPQFCTIKEKARIAWSPLHNMMNAPDLFSRDQCAYYHRQEDYINMPDIHNFDTMEAYFQVLYHELVHSTGHQRRLNREGVISKHPFGSWNYSKEELVAEIGSCFLMHCMQLETPAIVDNSAAYIQGWLKALHNDRRMIVEVASKAQQAVDYVLHQKRGE